MFLEGVKSIIDIAYLDLEDSLLIITNSKLIFLYIKINVSALILIDNLKYLLEIFKKSMKINNSIIN